MYFFATFEKKLHQVVHKGFASFLSPLEVKKFEYFFQCSDRETTYKKNFKFLDNILKVFGQHFQVFGHIFTTISISDKMFQKFV